MELEAEEYVNLRPGTELLQQQDMFKELLQQQQENFKGLVEIIMGSTNTRMDGVRKDVQEVSLQFTKGDVDKLKDENSKLNECLNTQQTDLYKLSFKLQ